jgi:hypothetical protein
MSALREVERRPPTEDVLVTLNRAQILLSERERIASVRLRYGRLAGVLFIAGGLAYLFAGLDVPDSNHLGVYIVTVACICSGVICAALPWERLPNASLHVLIVIAVFEVAAAVWASDPDIGAFFILVAVFAAYAVETRRQILAHLGLIALVSFAPLLYNAAAHTGTLHHEVLYLLIAALAAGMVTYLSERAEAQEQALRSFTAEAIDVAGRLLGDGDVPVESGSEDAEIATEPPAQSRWGFRRSPLMPTTSNPQRISTS